MLNLFIIEYQNLKTRELTDKPARMSIKELFSVLKRGKSSRHSVPRSFMWILFSLLFMWSIILETKYFFEIEICSRFWANDPGLSWLNNVTNISKRTSSSVISKEAKSTLKMDNLIWDNSHFRWFSLFLTHFLHKLHQIVNKWNIFGGYDKVLSSKPDSIDPIQKFTIFIIKIALNNRFSEVILVWKESYL